MAILRDDAVYLGTADGGAGPPQYLRLDRANRHGLVTGATGTGKTVTLQVLAEGFSAAGVPVFCADVKGDLSGLSMPGEPKEFLQRRAETIGLAGEYAVSATPAIFWDLFGEKGHPVRTTVSEMGPLLLSRLLGLSDVQEGVLNIVFRVADEEGLLLLDLKDLRALLAHVAKEAPRLGTLYGNVSGASVGAIQRQLLVLENEGANVFFGEPALAIGDLMRTTTDGRGVVSVLAADRLMGSPRLYATFLLWLLSELFEELPEVGDPDIPRLAFFFDEAHLLFDEAPKALQDKVEQVVRLIRSKGVGVYFVTQNPLDVPDDVLGQLGNRIQHALRAYTPRDQRAVKAAADTFRPNPALDTAAVITELGTGEALVSTLDASGAPTVVERTLVRPPAGRIGPVDETERRAILAASPVGPLYDRAIDRESAHEMLARRAEATAATTDAAGPPGPGPASPRQGGGGLGGFFGAIFGTGAHASGRLTPAQRMARDVARSVTGQVAGALGRRVGGRGGATTARALARGVLGGLLRR